jgi:hypothetical protein
VAALRRLGRRVGGDPHAIRVAVARHENPVRLSAVYLLEAAPSGEAPELTALAAPDPRLLLASSFNLATRSPARLVRHLDVCAAIAGSVRVVRARLPWDADHRAVAQQLHADAERARGADQ